MSGGGGGWGLVGQKVNPSDWEVQGFELLGTEPLDTAFNPWDFRDLRRSRPASRSPPSRPVTPVRVECPFLVRAVKPQDEGRTRSPLTQFVQRMNIDAECGEEWNDEDFKRQISDLKRQISFGRQISPVTGFGKFATRANRFVENPNSESFSRQTSNSRNGPDSYDNRLSAPASRAGGFSGSSLCYARSQQRTLCHRRVVIVVSSSSSSSSLS